MTRSFTGYTPVPLPAPKEKWQKVLVSVLRENFQKIFYSITSLGTEDLKNIKVLDTGNAGINQTTPVATLDVKQDDSAGVKPVLKLEQLDVSEEMIEFACTIGTGNGIEAIGAKTLTTTHFIKVTLPGGLTTYIPCGTIA